jgi:hypothetical protein
MSEIAATMPEARYQRVNKRVSAAHPAAMPQAASASKEIKPKQEKTGSHTKKASSALAIFWPIAVGMFLSGYAQEWHAMAAEAGAWALRFTFPYPMLAALPVFGLGTVSTLPSFLVWAEVPIDGVLMTILLARGKGLKTGILQILALHVGCTLVLALAGVGGR